MANRLKYPFMNPLHFFLGEPGTDSRYTIKDFEDWDLGDTILPWEQEMCWKQPWKKGDHIHLQLQSSYGPVNLVMYREDESVIDTIPMDQIAQNANDPDLWIYEVDVDTSGYPEGFYFFRLKFGIDPPSLVIRTGKVALFNDVGNSIFIEYSNYQFREDMIFETGFTPNIRVPGVKKFKKRETVDTAWEDEELNIEMVKSRTYRLWEARFGLTIGLPDYMIDKLPMILGCSSLAMDGKYFTKKPGDAPDPITRPNYPLKAVIYDMRERYNRPSRHYSVDQPSNTRVAVMINVDSKGFGADTGGNETVIQDVE